MLGNPVVHMLAALLACAYGVGCGDSSPATPSPPVPVVAAILIEESILGGQSTTGTAVLNSTALLGGTTVRLTVDNPAVSVSETVNTAAGARTATFEITSRQVMKTTTAVITATTDGVSRTAPIMLRVDPTVLPPPTTNYTITFSRLPGPSQPVSL